MEFHRLILVLAALCAVCVTAWERRDMPPTRVGRHQSRGFGHHANLLRALRAPGHAEDCDEKPADIVFCLDGSSSIWGPHFDEDQKNFVKAVVNEFTIGPPNFHVGVITFASDVNETMELNDNKAGIIGFVEGLTQPLGNTYTNKCLNRMFTMFQLGRPSVPHIGIVITDGESAYGDRTTREAKRLKDNGVTMFAIGVGQEIGTGGNQTELRNIASEPSDEYVFAVQSYEMLDKLKLDLADKACQATTPSPTTPPPQMIKDCDGSRPLDVLFSVPDEAGIIDTELSLQFVQEVVDGFKISPTQVQAGLTPRLCEELDGIMLSAHDEKENLKDALNSRNLVSTQLSLQLTYMLRYAFTVEDGARGDAKKVAIMVVDNRADDAVQAQLLAAEAKEDEDITLIVIGVGPYVDRQELTYIATSTEHVYFVENYDLLLLLPDTIRRRLCSDFVNRPPQMIEGCRGNSAMDVWMAGPDESGIRQTEYVTSFMQNVTNDFKIGPSHVQVGLTPRLCQHLDPISLKEHDELDALKTAIFRRRLTSSLVSQQLEFLVQRGFAPGGGVRQGARRFALLIVDNAFADPQLTFRLAEELKAAGVNIIVVGIGPYAEELNLMQLASSYQHVFMVDSYDNLDSVLVSVKDTFCRGITT